MMRGIGVQTHNVVKDEAPRVGFEMLKEAGFTCADFSLNGYLPNTLLYQSQPNSFFDRTLQELEDFFAPHKQGAEAVGIKIHQMHMPYPVHVPGATEEVNDYLRRQVAPKSMGLCHYFGCRYMVVHGFKLSYYLGSEEAEWRETEAFLESLAPYAKEAGITICIENLYESRGGRIKEGPCCDAGKAVERIERMNDRYGAEVLGFCFDTGHANLVGIDMEKFLARLGSHLKVLHIHDNDGIRDLHQIPYTFTKTRENRASTDWGGFLKGLRNIGYEGVLSFETSPSLSSFPEEMKADVLTFIARIGRHFAKEI